MSTDPVIDPAHALPAASTLRRSRFRWRIVAFVALIAAILAVAGRFATENGLSGDQIARVVIDGTITTDAGRLAVLEALAKNDTVKAVVVAINSPEPTMEAAKIIPGPMRRNESSNVDGGSATSSGRSW